jgi:hypothetical protein
MKDKKDKKVRGVLAGEVKTRKNANCGLLRKGWA